MAAVLALGAFGAVIGSFLNVVIYRVPRGRSIISPPSACGACGHPVRPYDNIPLISWVLLAGKCRDCAAPISVRYPAVEAAAGVLFGLTVWRFLPDVLSAPGGTAPAAAVLELVLFLYFAAISVALAVIDIDTHRLPNVIVLPAYAVATAALVAAAALAGAWGQLGGAVLGLTVLGGGYLVLALLRPGAMGMGDVKLAGVIGMLLGWLGLAELAVGAFAGVLLGGLVGLALLAAGRGRRARLAYGPWLLAGAWIAILAGEPLARLYLALFGITT